MRMRMAYGNRMYLRDGPNTYRQPEWKDQVAKSGWSWGVAAEDFDLDRDVDLYIANGHHSGRSAYDYCTRFWCHDIYFAGSDESAERLEFILPDLQLVGNEISWNGYEKNIFFLHVRPSPGTDAPRAPVESMPRFANVAFLLGLAEEADCRHVASGDLDRDGRPDLLLVRRRVAGGKDRLDLVLYRNALAARGRHWIGVDLAPRAGTSPLGAKVSVRTNSGTLVDAYVAGDSFGVLHAPTIHFGLGEDNEVAEIRVDWPGGGVTAISNPVVDRYHRADAARPQN
jgi:hypothetical protein